MRRFQTISEFSHSLDPKRSLVPSPVPSPVPGNRHPEDRRSSGRRERGDENLNDEHLYVEFDPPIQSKGRRPGHGLCNAQMLIDPATIGKPEILNILRSGGWSIDQAGRIGVVISHRPRACEARHSSLKF
jgi:hypothetical protein